MKKETKQIIAAAATVAIAGTICCIKHTGIEKEIKHLTDEVKTKEKQIEMINDELEKVKKENEHLNEDLVETLKQVNDAKHLIEKYNADVSFNENDVTKTSNTTENHMKRALKDTGLYKDSYYFVKAEEEYGVNAYFLAAICANESSWGNSSRAINQNNLTGYAVYSRNARGATFSSSEESIMTTAKLLKENYLTPDAICFNGYSVVDVNKKYCFLQDQKTIDYDWSKTVTRIAKDLIERANNFKKI